MGVEAVPHNRAARAVIGVVAGTLAALVLVHLGMIFLHVAPANAVSRAFAGAVDGYIRPELRQNWKLFAPDPISVERVVEARAEIAADGGGIRRTEWVDLSAVDIAHTTGNLLPSHTRNQLHKGWLAFLGTHDDRNRPRDAAGVVAATLLKRVALLRLGSLFDPHGIRAVQLRTTTYRIPPPRWAGRGQRPEAPSVRSLPWWPVTDRDFPAGSGR